MSTGHCKYKHVLITGVPGIGKTTLIRKIYNLLKERNIPTVGFYTEEIKNENRTRIGFDVVTLDGTRGRLARTSEILKPEELTKYKVGKYVVFVKEFDSLTSQIFNKLDNDPVLVIDEIGKMELFSDIFAEKMKNLFNIKRLRILATIPVRERIHPVVDKLRSDPQNVILTVSRENRNKILEDVMSVFDV